MINYKVKFLIFILTILFLLSSTACSTCEPTAEINFFGNSITTFKSAISGEYSYAQLIGKETRYNAIDNSISGNQLANFFPNIYSTWIYTDSLSIALFGYNDMRYFGTDITALRSFKRSLYSSMVWLSIPTDQIIFAQSGDVGYTGNWNDTTYYGGNIGKHSDTSGSTATFTLSGPTVYIDIMQYNSYDRKINICIDGLDYEVMKDQILLPRVLGCNIHHTQ